MCSQADKKYEISHDIRGQLRCLEELDKVERKRHDEMERELLLRAAKSRSKSEDPEQVKLKAKAKEVSICRKKNYSFVTQYENGHFDKFRNANYNSIGTSETFVRL